MLELNIWKIVDMFESTDSFTITVKRKIKSFKSFLNLLIGLCAVLAIAYFLYNGLVQGAGDNTAFEYTDMMFTPLADFLHPEITDTSKFFATATSLVLYIIPLFVLHIIADWIQKTLLDINEKVRAATDKNLKKRKQEEYIKEFTEISYYSIAVSFDYKSNTIQLPTKVINQLNKVIYEKMTNNITGKNLKKQTSGVFAITSYNFEGYDELFGRLLKVISKIKSILEEKYKIEIIPTITTDAYTETPIISKIVTTHFAIKGCNLRNKAINTNLFNKKYNYLDMHKYEGISIGIYNGQTIDSIDKEYDLYVVIRNLNDSLCNF
jgi:hypothetical protein